jgi:hypothetical protein
MLRTGYDYYDKDYSDFTCCIMSAVARYSEGFVVDIAKRFSDISNKYEMSEKQQWCIAYAFLKIKNTLGEEVFSCTYK